MVENNNKQFNDFEAGDENNKGMDLSDAIKGSDTGVKFEEEKRRVELADSRKTSKIIQWVIKHSGGLVKNKKQANYILLVFFGIAMLLTIILLIRIFSDPSVPPAGPPQTPTSQSSGEFGEPPGISP